MDEKDGPFDRNGRKDSKLELSTSNRSLINFIVNACVDFPLLKSNVFILSRVTVTNLFIEVLFSHLR